MQAQLKPAPRIVDYDIALDTHVKPKTMSDKVAYAFVRLLRFFADKFFAKRYGHRAIVLETVAEGWIRTLLDEAENERMHLMTFIEIAQPNWFERFLVMAVQLIFYNCYFFLYLFAPRTAHRVVGYFEEEAVISYTQYLKEVEEGRHENVPAPQIAIDYWQLDKDATLRDVIIAVRADEAEHRDVNHSFVDTLDDRRRS